MIKYKSDKSHEARPHREQGEKITAANIFNCQNLHNFMTTIDEVLPYSGFARASFFLCSLHGVEFLTKLCFFNKDHSEIYDRSTNMTQTEAEIRCLALLNQHITEKGISPCIVGLVYNKICEDAIRLAPPSRVCVNLLLDHDADSVFEYVQRIFCTYRDSVNAGLAHNKCAFLVLERCDITLRKFIMDTVDAPIMTPVFKSIIFQIIYVFYSIKKIWPKFRHNDLHADNVMLKYDRNWVYKATQPRFLMYNVEGVNYSVPYFGIIPKIIDFGFAEIPEVGIVSTFSDNKSLNASRSGNDMIWLFHYIYTAMLGNHGVVNEQIIELLRELEPNETFFHNYAPMIRNLQGLPDSDTMIHSVAFSEYREYTPHSDEIHAWYGY